MHGKMLLVESQNYPLLINGQISLPGVVAAGITEVIINDLEVGLLISAGVEGIAPIDYFFSPIEFTHNDGDFRFQSDEVEASFEFTYPGARAFRCHGDDKLLFSIEYFGYSVYKVVAFTAIDGVASK